MQIKNKLLLLLVMLTCGISAAWAQQHVTVADTQNGTVTVDNASATAGDIVTITVKPDADYQIAKSDIVAEATIDPGNAQSPILRDAGPNVGMNIALQGDDPSDLRAERTYTFIMPEAPYDVLITASFTAVTYYNITVADTEHGSVEADKARAIEGETVNLTVNPAPGYELETLTYTVEGSEPVAIENNSFQMPAADVIINATFKAIEYHYGVEEEVKCSVVNASGFAPEGQTITMRIVPDSGAKFKEAFVYKVTGHGQDMVEEPINFTINPVEGSDDDVDLSFVMPAGDVEAHIICADAYSITVNFGENGSAGADKIEAVEGETVTVSTYPNEGYKVNEIYYTYLEDGTEKQGELTEGEDGKYTFTMPASAVSVVVTFKTLFDYYKLKFDAAPTGGTVSVEANGTTINSMDEVAEFSTIRVVVTPAEGYVIDSFNVIEGIGLSGGGDPMIDEISEPSRADGDNVTFIVYEEGIYGFEMPRNDATILVTFKPATYNITVADGIENGTVTAPESAAYGETVTLIVTPVNDEYELSMLSVTYDDRATEAMNRTDVTVNKVDDTHYTFEMPSGNVLVNATFTKKVTTSIGDINTANNKTVRYFDLQGRYIGTSLDRVSTGIYITSDGQKVIK